MIDTTHDECRREPIVHAERRIRTLLAVLDPGVRNLGSEIVADDAFRSEEWPRRSYALTRADVEALLAHLDQARAALDRAAERAIRLGCVAAAIDPAVHTPERVTAHLGRLDWIREGGGRIAELWRQPGEQALRVTVPLIPDGSDYERVLGFLVSDVARAHGVGELQVLKDIAEAGDA